jgi:hypothetical protein
MIHLSLVLLFVTLMGCGSRPEFRPQPTATESGIAVLFAAPSRPHTIIGTIEWEYYRPGWRAPMITDAMDGLREKAAAAGGDAVIVTRNAVDPIWQRTLYISANVIKYVGDKTVEK